MSNQRYTPEFKEEAVRQVLEKNHSVPTVAERLWVLPRFCGHFREARGLPTVR
jgi:transposase-like protein